jgi:hypothetical protein
MGDTSIPGAGLPTGGGLDLPAMNKMFVMIPVMLMARNISGDDPVTINYVRIAYGLAQIVCLSAAIYVYIQASKVTDARIVYVPAAKTVGFDSRFFVGTSQKRMN